MAHDSDKIVILEESSKCHLTVIFEVTNHGLWKERAKNASLDQVRRFILKRKFVIILLLYFPSSKVNLSDTLGPPHY